MDYKKMMGMSKDKDMHDKMKAKRSVIEELRKMASDAMGEDIVGGMKGMKKVTVAAPDEESLEEGLDVAENLVSRDELESEEDASLDPEEEMMELPDDPEEIDRMIAALEAKKAELSPDMEMSEDEESEA